MDKALNVNAQEDMQSAPSIGYVGKEHIPTFWPGVLYLLQEHEPAWLQKIQPHEVHRHLLEGNWDLWGGLDKGILDGIVIAQWDRFDRVKNYKIMIVVGVGLRKYIKPGLEKMEKYALACGGTALDVEVLPRMVGMFRHFGYHEEAVVMRKNIVKRWGN